MTSARRPGSSFNLTEIDCRERFTNWPPADARGTSPLWDILGQGNMTQGLTLMLEQGYLQPKR